MTDYRLPENRLQYFTKLYAMNLEYGVMPGLVYCYMPELARRYSWSDEQRLWFAFLNGLTQNPITSLIMMRVLPTCPRPGDTLKDFKVWFADNWKRLQFDTDRRYQKVATPDAIRGYVAQVERAGSQAALLTGSYKELWNRVAYFPTFGRLSAFSYLEYVKIMGFGADCDDLMFRDRSGSRSHRNGMLLLHGFDHLVWDKRAKNGCTGKYTDFEGMCERMTIAAQEFLHTFRESHKLDHVGNFTLESNLCTFKNHFYGRRYPGVYADMAWERILWAEEAGWSDVTRVFREMREELLPEWLRCETLDDDRTIKLRAQMFPETGFPCRGAYFL